MRKVLHWLIRYLRNILIISGIVGIAATVLSVVFHFDITETLQYAGMACALIGLLSLVGKMNMTSNVTYLQSRSVSKSIADSTLEDFKSRDGNFRFLGYMLGTAVLLILVSFLIDGIIK
jgi:hypothetical protein